MRRLIVTVVSVTALGGLGATGALASGQPNQSCEDPGANPPPGFASGGFSNAESRYAGPGTPSANSGNDHAVSQYDVACFGGSSR
jgi:hypothetical protein